MLLDATHQDEDEHHHENDTKYAGWEVAKAARIAPIGQRADQQQNQDDDENCTEAHGSSPIVIVTLAGWCLKDGQQQAGSSGQDEECRCQSLEYAAIMD